MDTQPISNCCPKCHAPLPPDAPQGLCPKCLFAAVATPTEAGQPAGHRAPPPPREEIAAAFPQLEILEFIGQGGMGFVFKARQPKLDRLVALKILPQSLATDPTFAERFNREAKLLARLNHPGIVTVHDFGCVGMESAPSTLDAEKEKGRKGEAANKPSAVGSSAPSPLFPSATQPQTPDPKPHPQFYFLLMEFVDGVNLRQAMQAGRFTPEQALAIVPKICEALQFAHNEGILHRDIKPENILLDAKGRVKIADFGIAKLMERGSPSRSASEVSTAPGFTENSGAADAAAGHRPALHALTEAGKALGTPNYMAPEQLERPQDVDHRADIYSLGVVFYEMLTGELPLGRFAPPSQKSAADPRVDEVVLRALEKEKARRYASADEVKTQVETLVTSSSQREKAPTESGKRKVESEKQAEPRFSRMAIIGAIWAVALGLCALLENIGLSTHFIGPLSVLAPIITTALGWIAVSQIRRSAGKLYGLGLAVFDGLLFPLLALNFSIGCFVWVVLTALVSLISRDGHGSPSTALVILLSLPIAIPSNRFIIRRVWRAVNEGGSNVLPVGPSLARWAGAGLACVVCAIVSVAAFLHSRDENADHTSLTNRPDKLRSLPTDKLIQVGLADPQSPWAWQELEKRAKAGDFHSGEANKILDGLTTWIQREYPQGYNRPLFWMGGMLRWLNQPHLVNETNVLAFLTAYWGNPAIEPLPRIRENKKILPLDCKWRSPGIDQQTLGFELLNEMRSITIDGQQIPASRSSPRNWSEWQYMAELALPKLSPGKHVVRCEVDSAFVATTEMAGLAKDASSKDWPPAKRRWTRVCEAEFTVHANDAEIVSLTDDPALNPVAGGALAIPQVIIRSQGGRLTATVSCQVKDRATQPVSVDVTLRLAGQTIHCGNIYEVNTFDGRRHRGAGNDHGLTADIGPLDPQIKEAEILLTPNPKAVEEYPYVDRIWGKEIVISNVPLSRQDLYGAKPPAKSPTKPATNASTNWPNRDYYMLYAWDVSYNLTTNVSSLDSRWQLLLSAISKLRDEGLKEFPHDAHIHRELAWLFQHRLGLRKVGGETSLASVSGFRRSGPVEADPDQIYFRYQWLRLVEKAQADGQLQARLKLDPAVMKSVDAHYGPLDWRLPESHAIYWAYWRLNSQQPLQEDDLTTLQRVIYRSLQHSYQHGKLIGEPTPTEMHLERNLDLVPKVDAAYLQQISSFASEQAHIRIGHRNFLLDAIVALHEAGRKTEASTLYDRLGKLYPDKPTVSDDQNSLPARLTCEEFVRRKLNEK